MVKKNPFQYGKPVQDPRDFFGREREIKNIYSQILTSHSVSLVGERKIGKTSLFLHLVHSRTLSTYNIVSRDVLMCYMDISSCSFSSSSDLFRAFLEHVSHKTTMDIEKEINILLRNDFVYFREFENIISKINDLGQKIVFFLDEFENILEIRQKDIFLKLRYLAQIYDVTFVVSTLHDLASLIREKRIQTSPFFNIFTEYRIQGLDENACRDIIIVVFGREGIEVDSSVVDSIIEFSGNNPYFLKVACYRYFEKLMISGKSITHSRSFDEFLKSKIQQDLEPHHKYNWEHLPRTEKAALLDILRDGITGDSSSKSRLERKGYIGEGKAGLYIISESFCRFLKDILNSRSDDFRALETQIIEIDTQNNLTENDRDALMEAAAKIQEKQSHLDDLNPAVFEIIGYFEMEMRKFIMNILEVALGSNWFKHSLDKKSREEIEKRISRTEERIEEFQYPENPLDYAILEMLSYMILRRDNWNNYFSEYFKDKQAFEVKMKEIISTRNLIAHYHSIRFNESVTVIQNILWILDHVRKKTL